jgi:AcrR family transcriptional regulator
MDTRSSIIEHALKELERKGLNDFSVRAVGKAVGLSAMAVYRHFKNKEDLLRAVGEAAFDSYNKAVAAIPDLPAEQWLLELGRVYAAFAVDDPERFDACFVLRTRVERIYPPDFSAGKSPVISMAVQRIQAAQAARQFKEADPMELALLMWAQIHGLVMLYRSGRFSLSRTKFLALCERATQSFISNMLQPSAPTRATRKNPRKAGRS